MSSESKREIKEIVWENLRWKMDENFEQFIANETILREKEKRRKSEKEVSS
jgi:hypothetical protein